MSSDPANRLEELQAQLQARKVALRTRVDALLNEAGDAELPSLETLREERVRLTGEVRHYKDEEDALALEVDSDPNVSAVYQVAARVQRLEYFAECAEAYVERELPAEVSKVAASDKNHIDDEVAAHITKLQQRRESELKKINTLQERTSKRAKEIRNGPKLEQGERHANCRSMKAREEKLDKETQEAMQHTSEIKSERTELLAQVKKLRQERSKLQAELLEEKHKGEKAIHNLETSICHVEVSNTRDTRRCQELNTSNAALTINLQTLMGQLNMEHYGLGSGPSEKRLLQARRDSEAVALQQASNNRDEEKVKQNHCNENAEPQ